MAIPDWMKQQPEGRGHSPAGRKTREGFLDKTLEHIVSFAGDTMFNERTSSKNGLLQGVEPRVKIPAILLFIVLLSLQKSLYSISLFFLFSLSLSLMSKIPPCMFLQRLLPVFLFTLLISAPAALNLFVRGEPLIRLYAFGGHRPGLSFMPQEIYITKQGLLSSATLILRVTASVSLVLLLSLTTPPNRFIKAVSYFMPGASGSIASISYRYIFFLLKKVEEFILGFKSRNITCPGRKGKRGVEGTARKWAASRMALLFSISLKLSTELQQAMESRGYRQETTGSGMQGFTLSQVDIWWILLSAIFIGAVVWKYST